MVPIYAVIGLFAKYLLILSLVGLVTTIIVGIFRLKKQSKWPLAATIVFSILTIIFFVFWYVAKLECSIPGCGQY